MEQLTVKEIVLAVQGKLLCGDENIVITGATTNSKEVSLGDLFIPVIGERVDAHQFIPMALEGGAVATFTARELDEEQGNMEKAYIMVEDTVVALQALAAYYRSKFEIPLIGITGSVGKTTTKEMIAAALETKFSVLKTQGNMNSQIGLALMMLRIEKHHEIAVIEMGISEEGEMEKLVSIARPSIAVVTNIGVSHIGQLGSRENIRKEKMNIMNCFSSEGILYLNGEDILLRELQSDFYQKIDLHDKTKEKLFGSQVEFFGTGDHCHHVAKDIGTVGEGTRFTYEFMGREEEIYLSVLGSHNVGNALVSLAIAGHFGIEPSVAKEGLRRYQPIAMRGQIYQHKGITIIDDTYNASPDSMKSAMGVLLEIKEAKRRFALLADVLELGLVSRSCHFEVGEYIGNLYKEGKLIDQLITVGQEAKAIIDGVKEAKVPIGSHGFDTNEEAVSYLKSQLRTGDAIIIKGSRGMHTEEIVKALMA